MTSNDMGQLVYLVVLLAAVGSWVFVQNRQSLGKTAQQLAIWGLIFLGVIAGYGLWGDIRTTVMPQQTVVADGDRIRVPRARDGHYYLTLQINGNSVDFLVDTGASDMVLNADTAQHVGIETSTLAYLGRAMTANGEVRTARVRLDSVSLGPVTDRNVSAWVNEGALEQSLLGMGYLQRFSGFEIRNNELILTR